MRPFRRRTALALLMGSFLAWRAVDAAETVEVTILDYKFNPAQLKIRVGTTVRWTNQEKRTSHSVLFSGPDGFEGERVFPGESWQHRFDRPGIFVYSCGPHPEMKGQIEVTP
jgi:plastocyanin